MDVAGSKPPCPLTAREGTSKGKSVSCLKDTGSWDQGSLSQQEVLYSREFPQGCVRRQPPPTPEAPSGPSSWAAASSDTKPKQNKTKTPQECFSQSSLTSSRKTPSLKSQSKDEKHLSVLLLRQKLWGTTWEETDGETEIGGITRCPRLWTLEASWSSTTGCRPRARRHGGATRDPAGSGIWNRLHSPPGFWRRGARGHQLPRVSIPEPRRWGTVWGQPCTCMSWEESTKPTSVSPTTRVRRRLAGPVAGRRDFSCRLLGTALLLSRAGELQLWRQDKSYFGKKPSCCQGFWLPKLKQDAQRKRVRVETNREGLALSEASHPE